MWTKHVAKHLFSYYPIAEIMNTDKYLICNMKMMTVLFWSCQMKIFFKTFFRGQIRRTACKFIFFWKINELVIDVSCIIPFEILEFFCVFHLKSFNFLKELLKIFLFRTVFYIIIFQNFIIYFFKTILADLFSVDIVIGL